MPAWIHDRAEHLQKKNPSMPEGQAWAIATQQAYAAGKAPSSYGTKEGRQEAKTKYDSPKSEYKKTADPSHKTKTSASLVMWKGFSDEFRKIAMATPVTNKVMMAKKMPGYARLNREPDAPSPVNQAVPAIAPPPVSVSTFP